MKLTQLLSAVVLAACVATVSFAQDKTAEVKRGPLRLVHDLTGTVSAEKVAELKLDIEHLSDLKADQVTEHGQKVSADQIVLSLDREPIEKQAHQLRQAHRLAELSFQEKRLEFEQSEQLNEMTRMEKERAIEQAEQDFSYWEEVTWPQQLEDLEDNQRLAEEYLQDAEDEYNQLKQMYDEDELVEESEELVLRRQKRSLDRSRKNFERTTQRYERNKEINLPRQERSYRDNHQRNMLRLQRDLETVESGFEKQRIEMEKAEIAFDKSAKDMEKLEQEMGALDLKAPFDGMVFHGSWPVSGKTVEIEADQKVAAKSTLLTVAALDELYLSVELTEEQLANIHAGTAGYAVPTAFPTQGFSVRVKTVEPVPSSSKKFDCHIRMQDAPADLLPGMTCSVKLTSYQNDSALLVPDAAVHTDNGQDYYVFVAKSASANKEAATQEASEADEDAAPKPTKPADSSFEKVSVTKGVSSGGQTEILGGLQEGDKVLLGRP